MSDALFPIGSPSLPANPYMVPLSNYAAAPDPLGSTIPRLSNSQGGMSYAPSNQTPTIAGPAPTQTSQVPATSAPTPQMPSISMGGSTYIIQQPPPQVQAPAPTPQPPIPTIQPQQPRPTNPGVSNGGNGGWGSNPGAHGISYTPVGPGGGYIPPTFLR